MTEKSEIPADPALELLYKVTIFTGLDEAALRRLDEVFAARH